MAKERFIVSSESITRFTVPIFRKLQIPSSCTGHYPHNDEMFSPWQLTFISSEPSVIAVSFPSMEHVMGSVTKRFYAWNCTAQRAYLSGGVSIFSRVCRWAVLIFRHNLCFLHQRNIAFTRYGPFLVIVI
jgi:hypothetical protein